jgi:hypothetical protein
MPAIVAQLADAHRESLHEIGRPASPEQPSIAERRLLARPSHSPLKPKLQACDSK